MSNCNHKCTTDPCSICTPPGVTGLTTCYPEDPCDHKVNLECVKYSGIDFSCLNVKNGDDLISVLLAILNQYFPPSYCCNLEGNIIVNPGQTTSTTSTSTTSSTSTSTSTTSTTTTEIPDVDCKCYELNNTTDSAIAYTYVDCDSRQTVPASIDGLATVYRCAVFKSITIPQAGVIVDDKGFCLSGCPPISSTTTTSTSTTSSTTTSTSSTTSTTTAGPCYCYKIQSSGTDQITYYEYLDCNGVPPLNVQPPSGTPIAPNSTEYFCAKPGSVIIDLSYQTLTLLSTNCLEGCPPIVPPPNIDCTDSLNFVVYNGSSSNFITDVFSFPSFFVITDTALNPGQVEKGVHGSYVGDVSVTLNVSIGDGCLSILINGVVYDSVAVLGSGTYQLSVNALASDCIQIILSDNPC